MKLTEEEKKAISIVENIKFKKYKIYIAKEMKDEIRFYQTEEERKAIDIVLNLIEKLQKENLLLSAKENMSAYFEFKRNYIPKDKIRKLLEKLNLKLDKLKQEMDKEYDMYGKSSVYLDLDEQLDYLYEIKELLEEE